MLPRFSGINADVSRADRNLLRICQQLVNAKQKKAGYCRPCRLVSPTVIAPSVFMRETKDLAIRLALGQCRLGMQAALFRRVGRHKVCPGLPRLSSRDRDPPLTRSTNGVSHSVEPVRVTIAPLTTRKRHGSSPSVVVTIRPAILPVIVRPRDPCQREKGVDELETALLEVAWIFWG